MNSITITVPWLPMLAGLGIIVAFFTIRRVVRGVKNFNLYELQEARRRNEETKERVFTHPWEIAFDGCQERTEAMAREWIHKWISEQKNLPLLSCEAAQMLAESVSGYGEGTCPILVPYLDVGQSVSDTSDVNLRAELPEVWYKFWKELEDYPARWSLFLAKISTANGKTPHFATRTSLTSKQASLLAKALGDASHGAELYASLLVRYIGMEGEMSS